jgi:hypothetical protein
MELTAAADGSDPSRKFITYYAFTGTTANDLPPFRDSRDQADGIPFAPNLDGRGNKQVPGLCSSCHGGAPRALNTDGPYPTYPENGDTGAHFLPLDLDNFVFDQVDPDLSRASQERKYRKTNKIVLIDHRGTAKFDEVAGIARLPAVQELIEGWYGGPGLPNTTFDGEFIPAGWLPPEAPAFVGYPGLLAGLLPDQTRKQGLQSPLIESEESAPGSIGLFFIVGPRIRRTPAMRGTGVDLDFCCDSSACIRCTQIVLDGRLTFVVALSNGVHYLCCGLRYQQVRAVRLVCHQTGTVERRYRSNPLSHGGRSAHNERATHAVTGCTDFSTGIDHILIVKKTNERFGVGDNSFRRQQFAHWHDNGTTLF